jgi:hypothetical protein
VRRRGAPPTGALGDGNWLGPLLVVRGGQGQGRDQAAGGAVRRWESPTTGGATQGQSGGKDDAAR